MGRAFQRRAVGVRVLLVGVVIAWLLSAALDTRADATRRRLRVPILMYHYVSVPPPDADKYRLDLSVTPDQFAAQLDWLRANGYTAITLDALYLALTRGAPLPERPVVLTFDDGYADAYQHAFRLLRQAGMPGTFFIVTAWVDENRPGYLTWEQVREMAASGMSIQSHSQTHPDLTDDCDYDCQVYQLLGSVETIEAQLGVRPRFFCYPGGRYNAALLDLLPQVGIVAAVTTQAGTLHVSDRPLELKRARVRGSTSLASFAWMVRDWRE